MPLDNQTNNHPQKTVLLLILSADVQRTHHAFSQNVSRQHPSQHTNWHAACGPRAGLVIRHTRHFPGGSTHFRGRQNVFIFCHHAGTASSQMVCLRYWQRKPPNHKAMKYFALPNERFTATSSSSAFPMFPQQLYQEQACSAVMDGAKESQEEERRAVESVKCLRGTRDGGRHLTFPNVCARHECRICKLFLIKRKLVPRDLLVKSSMFIEVCMGQCE